MAPVVSRSLGERVGVYSAGLPTTSHAACRVRRDGRLDEILSAEIGNPGIAPSAVVGWAQIGPHGVDVAYGACLAGGGEPLETIFDWASITKVLTALVAAGLVERGLLAWNTTVEEVCPELAGMPAASATLVDLLSHRAGLPSWGALGRRDPWQPTPKNLSSEPDGTELSAFVLLHRAASRIDEPSRRGRTEVYSDLGYVLAGVMISRRAGGPGALADGWEALCGATSASLARRRSSADAFEARVVPTEIVPWRGGVVRGEVHDENAFLLASLGLPSGHAGAFGTVLDAVVLGARFLRALDGDEDWLAADTAHAMVTLGSAPDRGLSPGPLGVGTHGIGWDRRSAVGSTAGSRFGARTFGHLGFTGTSLWVDPEARRVAVLLTNRTYPSRALTVGGSEGASAIRTARIRVHDALWDLDPTSDA